MHSAQVLVTRINCSVAPLLDQRWILELSPQLQERNAQAPTEQNEISKAEDIKAEVLTYIGARAVEIIEGLLGVLENYYAKCQIRIMCKHVIQLTFGPFHSRSIRPNIGILMDNLVIAGLKAHKDLQILHLKLYDQHDWGTFK